MSIKNSHYVFTPRVLNGRNARLYFTQRVQAMEKHIPFDQVRSLLDVGCGDGTFIRYIRQRHPRLDCTGVDVSVPQVRAAEAAAPDVRFMAGRAEQVPLAGGSFDIVAANCVLHHVDDKERAITEVLRLARPGGFAVFIEPNRWNTLIFFLSLIKKHERGQLALSRSFVERSVRPHCRATQVERINSLCYPYQKWPSGAFFNAACALENMWCPAFLKTHFMIIGEVN